MLDAPDNEKGKSSTTVNNVRHLAVVNRNGMPLQIVKKQHRR